jgi:hypothetical protein
MLLTEPSEPMPRLSQVFDREGLSLFFQGTFFFFLVKGRVNLL